MMPAWGVFGAAILIGSIFTAFKYTSFIPESATTVFVSILLGLVARAAISAGWLTRENFTLINSSVLNLVLLPIIIFTGGWSLNPGDFGSQFEHILNFAILGTVISTVIIGYLAFSVNLGHHMSIRECLVFAALISAIDPVATLTIFGKMNMPRRQPLLNALVFGESVINDAVAIVIFKVINIHSLVETETHWMSSVGTVLNLLFSSMLLGIGLSILLVFCLRFTRNQQNTMQMVMTVYVSAYFIFTLAETVNMSGIIATLFAGVVFRIYGKPHFSERGKESCDNFLECSAHFADSFVFLLCGASAALVESHLAFFFGLGALFFCIIARMVSVGTCSMLSNVLKHMAGDPNVITLRHQAVMAHSGLRGGIALVLSLEINGAWCVHKSLIIDATFIVICAMLLVSGSTTELMIQSVGLEKKQDDVEEAPRLADTSRRLGGKYINSVWGSVHQLLQDVLVGSQVSVNESKNADVTSKVVHVSEVNKA
eukprot:CAMPEP_0194518746 /NCGR_PEP_ID=MMETSP0253-20130528/52229_1 /TAXON_ID=2966 /ORGANISM="Noctiluca scintillans" /LENGTH=484 /DNA_ID=CAMNT_0039362817 /DNA_START=201 /DNA_END=1655 /DNA_ORIENTATION=-